MLQTTSEEAHHSKRNSFGRLKNIRKLQVMSAKGHYFDIQSLTLKMGTPLNFNSGFAYKFDAGECSCSKTYILSIYIFITCNDS